MPINGSAAPVCPTTKPQAPPKQPAVKLPALTRVSDLPSVINTVNQIIYMLNQRENFGEVARVTTPVRIYNPNDNSQWVDVERITYLNLQDPNTGSQIIWKY